MHVLRAALAAILLVLAVPALSQTTAGSSTQIVVPVIAQTASFQSEITVYNPNGVPITVTVQFQEAVNSSTPGPKVCGNASVPANRSVQFSLATQCTLGAGNHFGVLVLTDNAGVNPFYAYNRTQNFAGQGFSVEGFPAGNFNNQASHVTGLKRQAAAPVYQTNCFAGALAQLVTYTLKLFNDTTGVQIGSTINGSLNPYEQMRYLDVFGLGGVNAGPGDQFNVRAEFVPTNGALLVGFCTVQDNASLGADSRIAKSYGSPDAFLQGGNAFGATALLGTTDNQALDVRVNNGRVMRYEPSSISPNVIGGSPANSVTAGVRGATIAGGGVPTGDTDPNFINEAPNRVTDAYGTVGGGYANVAGDDSGTTTDRPFASVGGGYLNTASGNASTVGGGISNTASGVGSVIGGGVENTANAFSATVGGGNQNTASGVGSVVGGGFDNIASGQYSTVGGGDGNVASGNNSWAAGKQAKTQTADVTPVVHHGAFAWADYAGGGSFDFNTTTVNEFAARATGGVRFVTAVDGLGAPTRTVAINPNGELSFGAVTRQMLNFYGGTWGIGVQSSTQYFRTGNHFGWYLNGVHTDDPLDPGAGGTMLMTLTNGASASVVTGTLRAQVITSTSDRAQKLDFAAVDGQEVLARVVALPIETWAYRNEPGVRHMGPTGQAFQAAFGLGHDDKSIATVDADGVALAAIQGLNAKLEAKVAEQAREIAELRRAVEALLARTSGDVRAAAQ